eukprot:CAMPEP_0185041404 /NCGR_PEP_ID=MMETSP1103-20130426/40640_1 /TAXON_ID=36769 /ORGANISM="Paraphysomonas bandaiensis, Strain Caron Lab Isolate" /LENGTH=317 /DNA_ID=CAMNT_0027581111 /DNA_START=76 /DNA_END=1026 /DNA_ORIENTATION=+
MVSIEEELNTGILFVAIGVAFIGSYTAASLSELFRVNCKHQFSTAKLYTYLLAIAIVIACVSSWCVLLVGMNSLVLKFDGRVVSVRYDIGVLLIALICGVLMTFMGLFVATMDKLYLKERNEIVTTLMKTCASMTIGRLQNKWVLWQVIMLHNTKHIVMGGLLTGAGTCVVHYLLMTARIGPFSVSYNYGVIVGSVVVSCLSSVLAFWVLFRLLALHPHKEDYRLASAVIMTISSCGMHYTGMSSASYTFSASSSSRHVTGATMSSSSAVIGAVAGGILLSWIIVMSIFSSMRDWHYKLTSSLRASKKTVESMIRDE